MISNVHLLLLHTLSPSPPSSKSLSPSSNKCLQNETRFKHFCFVSLLRFFAWINGNETSKVQSREEINILLWKVLRDTISFWLLFLLLLAFARCSFVCLHPKTNKSGGEAKSKRKICKIYFLFCAINKLIKCNNIERERTLRFFVDIWSRSLAYSPASSRLIFHLMPLMDSALWYNDFASSFFSFLPMCFIERNY